MKSFRVFELIKCRITLISVDFTIIVQYLWLLSHLYWFDPLDLKCVCTNLVFVTRYVRLVNLNRKGIGGHVWQWDVVYHFEFWWSFFMQRKKKKIWRHVWQWDIAACSVSFWILVIILCAEKEEEKVPVDDTPCLICHKSTHPDMVSFCVWLSIGKRNSLDSFVAALFKNGPLTPPCRSAPTPPPSVGTTTPQPRTKEWVGSAYNCITITVSDSESPVVNMH